MNKRKLCTVMLLLLIGMLFAPNQLLVEATEQTPNKQMIYDEAGLLSKDQYNELNELANRYAALRETDIIVITSNNTHNIDVKELTQNFYDDQAPGYNKKHGNAVLLLMDMKNRQFYIAGFYKAETYLDNNRLDRINNKITPYMTEGDYAGAFETYISTAYRYMGFEPNVNPDNILFNRLFQLIVAAVIGAVAVSVMAIRNGGRNRVNRRTYEDARHSGIVEKYDRFLHTTVTKRKIERNSGGGGGGFGGGGGGGMTRGGHSHSGSRGSF